MPKSVQRVCLTCQRESNEIVRQDGNLFAETVSVPELVAELDELAETRAKAWVPPPGAVQVPQSARNKRNKKKNRNNQSSKPKKPSAFEFIGNSMVEAIKPQLEQKSKGCIDDQAALEREDEEGEA